VFLVKTSLYIITVMICHMYIFLWESQHIIRSNLFESIKTRLVMLLCLLYIKWSWKLLLIVIFKIIFKFTDMIMLLKEDKKRNNLRQNSGMKSYGCRLVTTDLQWHNGISASSNLSRWQCLWTTNRGWLICQFKMDSKSWFFHVHMNWLGQNKKLSYLFYKINSNG